MICFTVTGKPQGKARPRLTRDGHAYTPKETRVYEHRIRDAFLSAIGDPSPFVFLARYRPEAPTFPAGAPVWLHVTAFHRIPAAIRSREERERMVRGLVPCVRKPDLDNLLKIVADALNGCAYDDDRQLTHVRAERAWTDGAERIEVELGADE